MRCEILHLLQLVLAKFHQKWMESWGRDSTTSPFFSFTQLRNFEDYPKDSSSEYSFYACSLCCLQTSTVCS